MVRQTKKHQLHLSKMSELEKLSPFELKEKLIQLAAEQARASTRQMLNAGRGNPNWIATTPREAFLILGAFALGECKRTWDEPGFGGMPHKEEIAAGCADYLARTDDSPGARLLRRAIDYGVEELGFDADAFVHELVDAYVGDNYPDADAMLRETEEG